RGDVAAARHALAAHAARVPEQDESRAGAAALNLPGSRRDRSRRMPISRRRGLSAARAWNAADGRPRAAGNRDLRQPAVVSIAFVEEESIRLCDRSPQAPG